MHRTVRSHSVRLAISLVAAVAVVGCGGDDDDSATTEPTVDASATAVTGDPQTTDAVPATDPVETSEPDEATERATTTAPDTTAADTTGADTAEAATTVAAGGTPYTSAEGDYRVTFPGTPELMTQAQPLPDGSSVDIDFVSYSLDEGLLATARAVYPDGTVLDVPLSLQGAQDQAIANVGGTLLASQDITLQGRPGREFSATIMSGSTEGTLLQRVYLDGLVIYQQIFTGAGDVTFTDPEVAGFFESFAFTTG